MRAAGEILFWGCALRGCVLRGCVLRGCALLACVLAGVIPTQQDANAQGRGSRVIYPEQQGQLHFSHQLHAGAQKISCEGCHAKITTSRSSLDNNLPPEVECTPCHKIDRSLLDNPAAGPSARCERCHVSFSAARGKMIVRGNVSIPNLKFGHEKHLSEYGSKCEQCHGDMARVKDSTSRHLPSMATCRGCHNGKLARDECTTCHLAEAGTRMQTQFPGLGTLVASGSLRGAAHNMEFGESHKYAAQNDSEFCASCHQKDFCAECHNGVRKPMAIHLGDYVRMHSIEARRNSPDCSGCHRLQTFCQGCHSRMGVADDKKGGQFGGTGQYHPVGWNVGSAAGRDVNHHAFQAQRNIKQCASCHRESYCTRCHSAQRGSPRVNPHPRNWRGSRRCRALQSRNQRMCLRCHIDLRIDCY